eukprot:536275-Amphidinium_carterae.1
MTKYTREPDNHPTEPSHQILSCTPLLLVLLLMTSLFLFLVADAPTEKLPWPWQQDYKKSKAPHKLKYGVALISVFKH